MISHFNTSKEFPNLTIVSENKAIESGLAPEAIWRKIIIFFHFTLLLGQLELHDCFILKFLIETFENQF